MHLNISIRSRNMYYKVIIKNQIYKTCDLRRNHWSFYTCQTNIISLNILVIQRSVEVICWQCVFWYLKVKVCTKGNCHPSRKMDDFSRNKIFLTWPTVLVSLPISSSQSSVPYLVCNDLSTHFFHLLKIRTHQTGFEFAKSLPPAAS
jgi:hypothetical protein